MDNEALATELLKEIKATSKRWFIAFLVVLGLWFGTIGAFIWYITLPIDETTIEQGVEDVEDSDIKQMVGDDYGESVPESNEETQSR